MRRSLAASLHEISKIIGPEATVADLLPLFDHFLLSDEAEVRAAAADHLDELLTHVPPSWAEVKLRLINEHWRETFSRDWRLRERVAQLIEPLATHLLLADEEGNLVALMQHALCDPVASVRAAGTKAVPSLYKIFADHDDVIADGFLGIISDMGDSEKYRDRLSCLLCVQALIESGIQRSAMELTLLQRILRLGKDPVVDVRILLARVVYLMCSRGASPPRDGPEAQADQLSLADELYALPYSRSEELKALIQQLTRDRNDQVRDTILPLLSDEEREQPRAAPSPELRRDLVLGPAEGGPHKPEPSAGVIQIGSDAYGVDDMATVNIEVGDENGENTSGYTASLRQEDDDGDDKMADDGPAELQNGRSTNGEAEDDWLFNGQMDVGEGDDPEGGQVLLLKERTHLYSPLKPGPFKTGDGSKLSPAPETLSASNSDPFLAFVADQQDEAHGGAHTNGTLTNGDDAMEED